MFFSRCVYHLPEQDQRTYWEDTWAGKGFDALVRSQTKKEWWDLLEAVLAALPEDALILDLARLARRRH